MDEPINFVYQDTDSFKNEISELYSYSEESEFFANRNAFEESMEDCGLPLTWKHMDIEQKIRAVNHLMTILEVSCRTTRIKSCRALAYLIQGNFGECSTLEEQSDNTQENVFLLYNHGIFPAFVQQLSIEANLNFSERKSPLSTNSSTQIFNESSELRLILSVLYTITETIYHANSEDKDKLETRVQFVKELQNPFDDELLSVTLFQMLNNFCGGQSPHYPVRKITLLLWKVILVTLGGSEDLKNRKDRNRKMCNLDPVPDDTLEVVKNMVPCCPPMMSDGQARARAALTGGLIANKRKVFKQPAFDDAVFAYAKECLLNSLNELNQSEDNDMKQQCANDNNEENDGEESNDNDKKSDDPQQDAQTGEWCSRIRIRGVGDQDKRETSELDKGFLDDHYGLDEIITDTKHDNEDSSSSSDSGITENILDLFEIDEDSDINTQDKHRSTDSNHNQPSRLTRDAINNQDGCQSDVYKGLPWKPKVRKADLQEHLSELRQKFLGYSIPNDLITTFGLPGPIIEGINVLKRHLYVSIAELQIEREEMMQKYPLTHGELFPKYRDDATEKLYAALLPRLPQHMIALLKILLAASSLSSADKSDRVESINIMAEINMNSGSQSIIHTVKMNVEAMRHKEIIIKSISAIILLLLKHFKANHIYQFEYVSQQLMFANCIPLILKFLSQDIYSYIVNPRSTISTIEFPACVIGQQPEITTVAIEMNSFLPFCWRNMFSCINLVRILNKLTKWKHSRIMMLVVFKSSQTLLKALSVRHPMFQLYVLKLLKVQLKFLGRQWKKSNMRLISPIYQKVRHRLTDDWAYSNDNEARPWDFQAEEFTLQANINRFHQRRYHDLLASNGNSKNHKSSLVFKQFETLKLEDNIDEDYISGSFDLNQITPNFEKNYEKWLDSEVFQRQIDWDRLIEQ